MSSIAFITTCKGRLEHVKETLPLIVAQQPDEIIVVDYACPQKTGDWVKANYPRVNVVRTTDTSKFCVARARNIGFTTSKSEWLCFIDADIKVAPGFVAWLRDNLDPAFHWRAARLADGSRDKETWGTALCTRAAFERIGGYDEAYTGWGGEDDDLYHRLSIGGLPERAYPNHFVDAIRHDDEVRMALYEMKEKRLHLRTNGLYREIKGNIQMGHVRTNQLSLAARNALMQLATKTVTAPEPPAGAKVPVGRFEVNGSSVIDDDFELLTNCKFTFEMRRRTR